jgi:hypothetical protein
MSKSVGAFGPRYLSLVFYSVKQFSFCSPLIFSFSYSASMKYVLFYMKYIA